MQPITSTHFPKRIMTAALGCLYFIGVFVLMPAPGLAEELPPVVLRAVKDAGIAADGFAVYVRAADGRRPLIEYNASKPMNPASTMKLVTTYAALELLGPAHSWKTQALVDTLPVNGRLGGNVYLRGSGDPRLALEQFWLLLRELRGRGIDEIQGDLVLDRSAFAAMTHDPAAFDNEPLRPYNAGPDALLVNLKSIGLRLAADRARGAVTVVPETPVDTLRIDNRLRLTDEPCGDWREALRASVNDETIVLQGSFANSCNEKMLHLSPWSADRYAEQLFRVLWRELGGTFSGKVRDGTAPATAITLLTRESPPLADIVRETNKYSNNVMARQIFLTLSAERPATLAGARQRVAAWLAEKGLGASSVTLDNGSGLSRSERISAGGLGQLLHAAWKSPVMPELMASLPLAGIDGTLKNRLGHAASTGRAHLKTGYLEGVRAIAGYVLDNEDRRWIVVFLINDPHFRSGKAAMDALLNWVAGQGSGRSDAR